jgi:hypothetical protein
VEAARHQRFDPILGGGSSVRSNARVPSCAEFGQALHRRPNSNNHRSLAGGQPITEAIWLDLLRKEIGDGPAVHRAMLAGDLILAGSGDYGPCFRRIIKKIRRFELGFDPKSLIATPHIIHGLMPDSEAAKAGLREGDTVNCGVALGEVNRTLTLQVSRDGKTFPLIFLPRGEAVDAYQWERIPGGSEDVCKSNVGLGQ